MKKTKLAKKRILDAAEELFATEGLEAVSLRDVTSKAKVSLASIHYHFGSRQGLVEAVIDRRLAPVNKRRMMLFTKAQEEKGSEPLAAEELLILFLCPLLDMISESKGGFVFMRLLGFANTDPQKDVQELLKAQYHDVTAELSLRMRKALPEIPEEEMLWRLRFMAGAMSYAMLDQRVMGIFDDSLAHDQGLGHDVDEVSRNAIVSRLVSFLTAGMANSYSPGQDLERLVNELNYFSDLIKDESEDEDGDQS